jgi:lipopolysaccharide export system protein LptA
VTTVSILKQQGKDGTVERVRTVGTSKSFKYDDAERRGTYTGDAHLSGPQGDMTAQKIDLFLRPSGDEIERIEAVEAITLRSENQKTTGTRLTYFDADGRYLVNGTPVTIVDQCGRETTGHTLTFYKATDRIIVDGNEQSRTQTKGKSNCPGT